MECWGDIGPGEEHGGPIASLSGKDLPKTAKTSRKSQRKDGSSTRVSILRNGESCVGNVFREN